MITAIWFLFFFVAALAVAVFLVFDEMKMMKLNSNNLHKYVYSKIPWDREVMLKAKRDVKKEDKAA